MIARGSSDIGPPQSRFTADGWSRQRRIAPTSSHGVTPTIHGLAQAPGPGFDLTCSELPSGFVHHPDVFVARSAAALEAIHGRVDPGGGGGAGRDGVARVVGGGGDQPV